MKKVVMAVAVIAILVAGSSGMAYAVTLLSGEITGYRNASIGSAKITAEAVNSYSWRIADSNGDYLFTDTNSNGDQLDSGETYNVAAMKGFSNYKHTFGGLVTTPATKDFTMVKQSSVDIKIILVTDENFRNNHPTNHESAAQQLVFGEAYDFYYSEHNIKMVKYSYKDDFTIGSERNCHDIGDAAVAEYPKASNGRAELIFVVLGDDVTLDNGTLGCIAESSVPSSYVYTAAVMVEDIDDPVRGSLHEIGHAHGLSHPVNGANCDPDEHFKTVMCAIHQDPMAIKGWSPSEDSHIVQERDWWRDGGVAIYAHRQSDDSSVSGLFAAVYFSNGTIVEEGYTPFYVDVVHNGTYYIDFSNYGNYYFTTPEANMTGIITDYAVYNWGGRVYVDLSDSKAVHLDGIYYDHANPGSYAKITYQTQYTDSSTLTGMFGGFKNSGGTILSKGYSPYTVGMPTGQNLTVVWNNFGGVYYQDAVTTATEVSDNKYSWGGEQVITMGTNGGTYTDTGKYSTSP